MQQRQRRVLFFTANAPNHKPSRTLAFLESEYRALSQAFEWLEQRPEVTRALVQYRESTEDMFETTHEVRWEEHSGQVVVEESESLLEAFNEAVMGPELDELVRLAPQLERFYLDSP